MTVSGTIDPDWTGIYMPDGVFNDKMSWKYPDEERYIAWDGAMEYQITDVKGLPTGGYWSTNSEDPFVDYDPTPPNTGTATVTAII